MLLATSTGDFTACLDNDFDRISALHEAGFRCMDLSLYTMEKDDPWMRDDWKDHASKIKAHAESLGMTFVQAHSPGGNPLCRDENWQWLLDTTLRSIEVCAELGIPNTVVHAGWEDGIGREEYFRKNAEFYGLLLPTAERCGVNVLTENSTHANMGSRYYFYTGADMYDFCKQVGHPRLHVCWDTGHANIEGAQYDEILALKDELYAVHINDNFGTGDQHTMPYVGSVNLDEVMHALIDVGFRGPFTFECDNLMFRAGSWQVRRHEYPADTRLANPPLHVKKILENALFEIGVHALTTYGIYTK